ncbi:MAG: aminotransferase class I/II-fold pyridoxal phosphate-dependent enzyme [Cryobacterium sp.]
MNELAGSPASRRATTVAAIPSFRMLTDYLGNSVYARRQRDPGVCDFAFGNPHEMPPAAYVDALREALEPQNEEWFAYQMNSPVAQAAASAALLRMVGVAFDPDDIYLTTGAFSAIALALKTVTDPGDEVIFSLPPWFLYEPILTEAGLTSVKVPIDTTTFDLDLAAIAAAITPRTRVVIVNSPNNPTGRIYPPELLRALAAMLEAASVRLNRRIYLLSDEAYNRIVYDGAAFHSPAEFYPHTLLAYTYGKTHLAPGERIGYLALPPDMPGRAELRETITALQISMGWIYPNASLQYALPRLEEFSIDIALLQRKRDRIVESLTWMGYEVRPCEGTFYLFVTSPTPDDTAFTDDLAQRGVFVLPGTMFETPGFFRISLTASEDTIERSLPLFADALSRARLSDDTD